MAAAVCFAARQCDERILAAMDHEGRNLDGSEPLGAVAGSGDGRDLETPIRPGGSSGRTPQWRVPRASVSSKRGPQMMRDVVMLALDRSVFGRSAVG